jgi:REP element-mobilizing transposase RayT
VGHTYSNLLVHVIFSTKRRAAVIRPEIRPRLHEYLVGIARHEFGRAIEIGGTDDHLHGLIALRTDVPVADAMRKWKSLSSGWLHRTFPQYGEFGWQDGYAAFSVSESAVNAVRAYIVRQEEHHRRMSFDQELRAFLDRHGVEYDPSHLLD